MSKTVTRSKLSDFVRDIPDYPKPGIVFKDITPLLGNAQAFKQAVIGMAEPWLHSNIAYVFGIESRGFMFGAAMATYLGAGFVPVRKPHKLPAKIYEVEYALEYGTDKLGVHQDAIPEGAKILIVDDVLATGGTMRATVELAERLGAEVAGLSFLMELSFLKGREKLPQGFPIHKLLTY